MRINYMHVLLALIVGAVLVHLYHTKMKTRGRNA